MRRGLYAGRGIAIKNSLDVLIENNEVHHCNSSGIRADKSDDIKVSRNIVYGNTWWTHSATSGIVFAESVGSGVMSMFENVVYGNRNFMPFFKLTLPEGGGTGNETYGMWN